MLRMAFVLLLLSTALAEGDQEAYQRGAAAGLPWYKPEMMAQGKLPYVTVYRFDLQEAARERNTPYEWRLPLSTVRATQTVSRDLIKAWQRLEERTYQHVMARIHHAVLLTDANRLTREASWALTKGFFELNPALPEVRVGTGQDHFPARFTPPLEVRGAAGDKALRLDWYSYYHASAARVPPSDYYPGVGEGDMFIFPYIPGGCVVAPFVRICSDGYPNPIWIDMGELEARARRGLEHAARHYIPDYEKDVLEAVRPRGNPGDILGNPGQGDLEVFIPSGWSGALLGSGALVTPVIRLAQVAAVLDDVRAIWDTLQQARYRDDNLNRAVTPYYLPALAGLLRRLGAGNLLALPALAESVRLNALSLLQGSAYRSQISPGIWPLEELKRWFPPSRPEIHEALGYTTFYQVFGKLDFTPLPDPGAAWGPGEYAGYAFTRSLHIWNVPIIYYPLERRAEPDFANIRPIPIKPYQVFYAGPRYFYDWVSVPEGYPIPRVKGVPLAVPVGR